MTMQMLMRGMAACVLCLAASLTAAAADHYPVKPIRIIVPVPPGGSIDITARLVAIKMSEKLGGQTIIVENRPGGDTTLGTRLVKEAPADGYTILATSNPFSTTPALKLDPGYDPLKDFTPIGPMLRGPIIIEVGVNEPDLTLRDLIARSKSSPLSYASPGVGGAPHLAAELMLRTAGATVLHVPYKGASAAYPDVVGGRVAMMVDGYSGSAPFLKAGKMRALAVTSASRIAPLPNVPTLAEQGIDVSYSYWLGLIVKKGTPREIVQILSEALRYATSNKDLIERFVADGTDPSFMTPSEFSDYIAAEITQVNKLVSDLNIAKQ